MSILRHLAPAGTERRDFSGPWGDYSGRIPGPAEAASSTAGVVINERTALSLIDAWACVSLVSDSMGMLPTDAFRRTGEFRQEVRPTPPLVAQPDPEMEPGAYWSGMTTSLMLRGNAYSLIMDRDSAGYPTAVKLLSPDDVHPRRNPKTKLREYVLSNGEVADRYEMIHVPWVVLPGEVEGLSPIGCARRGLGMSIATEDFGAKWFRDGAAPSSTLETDQTLEDAQAKRILARWIHSHGGRRRPAVLSNGLKWKPVTLTPNESQFLESRNLNTTMTCRIWRVPPHMVQHITDHASQGGGKGLEEQGIGYVVYTLGPYLTRFEAAFARQMPRPQYMKFKVGALLRGNTRDRFTSYAIGRQWGWLSVNDIRALEDLPPVDGGDVYLQPMNMVDAEAALKVLLTGDKSGPGGDE
jgi:HK97 family phage portal protein